MNYTLYNVISLLDTTVLQARTSSPIPKDSPEDEPNAEAKLKALKNIFAILESFRFNETVPRDFKRIILRPFLKNEDKDHFNPDNYIDQSLF